MPWFNDKIKEARRQRRKEERRWRHTGLVADLHAFKDLRNKTNNLMNDASKVFYRDLIDENSGDQKKLFSVANRLLDTERDTQYPSFKDKVVLANKFSEFFAQKIVVIQNKPDDMAATVSPCSEKCVADTPAMQPMDCFRVLNELEVQKLIMATPKKSCKLDPMPTPLVDGCTDILLPVINRIINLSLQTGSFADQWKCALVHPLLKTLGLNLIFQSFRPVSNLQYISKLTEKAVFSQTHEHMVVNEIYPDLQSSYCQHHSTEMALLR